MPLTTHSGGPQHIVGAQYGTCTTGGSRRPQSQSKIPVVRRCGCHSYVVHGLITVTGQPVTGSVDTTGRYDVTGTFFQFVW